MPWLLMSLEAQDYPGAFEVIICDDGSTKKLSRILAEFEKRGRLDLRYVRQPRNNIRLARTRNNGLRIAQGETIIFVDGDCVVPKNWISRHVSLHTTNRLIVGGTRRWSIMTSKENKKISTLRGFFAFFEGKRGHSEVEQQLQLFKGKLPWLACWGFNFSLSMPKKHFFDERFSWGHEDMDLFCRLHFEHDFKTVFSEKIEVYHLAPSLSASKMNPWSGKDSNSIGRYLQNLLLMNNKYPDLDLEEALWPFHYFHLDIETQIWRKIRPHERMSVQKGLSLIHHWRPK